MIVHSFKWHGIHCRSTHYLVWHWHKCRGVVAWVQEISHSNHGSYQEFRGSWLELPVFNHWASSTATSNYLHSQWHNLLLGLLASSPGSSPFFWQQKIFSTSIQIEDGDSQVVWYIVVAQWQTTDSSSQCVLSSIPGDLLAPYSGASRISWRGVHKVGRACAVVKILQTTPTFGQKPHPFT